MATDKLSIYNRTLRMLGQRKLANLAENVESRLVLDDLWTDEVQYCLEQGFWHHAMTTAELHSTGTPAFGQPYAMAKPSDFVRLYYLSPYEDAQAPLFRFVDEGGYWFTDVDPVYARYVSNASDKGFDPAQWPATFAEYVVCRLAVKACLGITSSAEKLQGLQGMEKRARTDARSKDAMKEGPKFPPEGSWARSRRGTALTTREHG